MLMWQHADWEWETSLGNVWIECLGEHHCTA